MSKSLTIEYRGPVLLDIPLLNKGSAFTLEERQELGLSGLIPERVENIEQQAERCYQQFTSHSSTIGQHVYLRNLQDTNETLFYRLICAHLEEMLPIVYTPTVGEACKQFSSIYRRARGLFISWPHREQIESMVNSVTKRNVKVIVITDGERILGLGDQGIGGMGIPIGKLSLYTACGGISPAYTLPIVVDVGTNNQTLLDDPMYMGWRHKRLDNDKSYLAMMDCVISGLTKRWPNALIQFEDFALTKANNLLNHYKDKICCFNDDIQGTAAVTTGALISAAKLVGKPLSAQKIVFIGAGSAGCGIASQLIDYLIEEHGLNREQAIGQVIVSNRSGVLHSDDRQLFYFQKQVAQLPGTYPQLYQTNPSLTTIIQQIQPDALIGVTGKAGIFSEQAIKLMASFTNKPIIFPLSNPTSNSEAVAKDLIEWTKGQAIIASGSPFNPVEYAAETYSIAQCNNCYIFPGIGLGVVSVGATRVTNTMMMAAARALADYPCAGILPAIGEITQVSRKVALAVAKCAVDQGIAKQQVVSEQQLTQLVENNFWKANYRLYKTVINADNSTNQG